MTTNVCTCHISNLRCKNPTCKQLIVAREVFRTEVAICIQRIFDHLKKNGFDKKESIRALRREILHKGKLQFDLFDQIAEEIWTEK